MAVDEKQDINQSINQNFNVTCAKATSLNRLMRQSIIQRDKLEILKLYVYNPKFRMKFIYKNNNSIYRIYIMIKGKVVKQRRSKVRQYDVWSGSQKTNKTLGGERQTVVCPLAPLSG